VYHALQAKQSSIWTSFFGHVSELDFMGSHQESKLIAIDKQATDNVMHQTWKNNVTRQSRSET